MKHEMLKSLSTALNLLDTCVIMEPYFEQMIDGITPLLRKNRIIIMNTALGEVQRLARGSDPEKAKIAMDRIRVVQRLVEQNVVEICMDAANKTTHNDAVLLGIVQKYHSSRDVIVFTNDNNLGRDIHNILSQKSISHKYSILILGLRKDSIVNKSIKFDHQLRCESFGKEYEIPYKTEKNSIPPMFRQCTTLAPTVLNTVRINAWAPIQVGSKLYTNFQDHKCIYLGEKISSGGEGTVYKTNLKDVVCKVYYPEKLTTCQQAKVELLSSRTLPRAQRICMPLAPVYDSQDYFRGFLMWEAKGTPLRESVQDPTWLEEHPQWTRLELAQLCCTIIEMISYIHRMNILIGDVNGANILVESPTSVWFVDCDSYQVEGFPCPVGMVSYTAPELQGISFKNRLRSQETELFSVAILLFMIMLPGKHPYAHQGGGDPAENIRKGHFPYPLGEKHGDCVPEGHWRYCWSHLSRPIKDAFFNCFHEEGFGKDRTSIDTWLRLFRLYCNVLKDPNETFVGPVQKYGYDLMIFPHNRRRIKGNENPTNALRTDGKTDYQVRQESLMAELEAVCQIPCVNLTSIPGDSINKPQSPLYVQSPVCASSKSSIYVQSPSYKSQNTQVKTSPMQNHHKPVQNPTKSTQFKQKSQVTHHNLFSFLMQILGFNF